MVIIPTEKSFDWKRTPLALFAIVLANILVFFLYQSGDSPKIQQALAHYNQHQLLQTEWPIYRDHLKQRGEEELIAEYQQMIESGLADNVSLALLLDFEFRQYLQANARSHITHLKYQDWSFQRDIVNQQLDSLSFTAGGLTPNDLSIFSVISYQFLHGDVLHLLSNLFFLVVCGFAVEAAIGHLRFLLFYLITGIAGGICHALFNLESAIPLVGASGAVSGVMAMYLGVFRFRKIEFFYWFFIFVGYFRAPAMLVLPFYIGKELFSYFSDTQSNVAFLAHAGGFAAGALLIAASYLFNRELVDQSYVEEDQRRDPFREQLAKTYNYVETFQFQPALRSVQSMIGEYGMRFELARLRCNLLKIEKGPDFQRALADVLSIRDSSPRHLLQQVALWRENGDECKALDDDLVVNLGIRLAGTEQFAAAEETIRLLLQRGSKHPQLGVLAKRLSQAAGALKQPDKERGYRDLAERLLGAQGLRL